MHLSIPLLIFGIIIVLLAGFALFVGYPIYHAIRVSKGVQAHAMAYEQHPPSPSMRILVAGDSTAVGTGAAYSKDSTAGRLGQLYPSADITNIGVNGLKLEGLVTRLTGMPDDQQYDLILIQIGANDVIGFTSMADIKLRLDTVLGRARELSPHVVVLTAGNIGLSPVFKWPVSAIMTRRTREVRTLFIQEIAARDGVSYVDLFKEKKDDIFNTDVSRYYAADLFHPTGDGYGVWFDSIQPLLLR